MVYMLTLGYIDGKCYHIWHTWILWERLSHFSMYFHTCLAGHKSSLDRASRPTNSMPNSAKILSESPITSGATWKPLWKPLVVEHVEHLTGNNGPFGRTTHLLRKQMMIHLWKSVMSFSFVAKWKKHQPSPQGRGKWNSLSWSWTSTAQIWYSSQSLAMSKYLSLSCIITTATTIVMIIVIHDSWSFMIFTLHIVHVFPYTYDITTMAIIIYKNNYRHHHQQQQQQQH